MVNFNGHVLAFLQAVAPPTPGEGLPAGLTYAVLDPSRSASGQEVWSAPRAVPFPTSVAPAGMRLIATTVPGVDDRGEALTTSILGSLNAPFRVLVVQQQLFLFRVAAEDEGALLVDRYDWDAQAQGLSLAVEARFQRSELADLPLNAQDVLGPADLEGDLFRAATTRISLDQHLASGFAVTFLPLAEDPRCGAWFVVLSYSGALSFYRIPRSLDAVFDLSDQPPVQAGSAQTARLTPSNLVQVTNGGLVDPAMALYAQREAVVTLSGAPAALARGARLLVVANRSFNADLVALDFAVSADGRLAVPTEALRPAALPLPVALAFDGRDDLLVSESTFGGYHNWSVEAWVRWEGEPRGSGVERVVCVYEDTTTTSDVVLLIDDTGALVVRAKATSGAWERWSSLSVVPRGRWTKVGLLVVAGAPPTLYANDRLVPLDRSGLPALAGPSVARVVAGVWRGTPGVAQPRPFRGLLGSLRLVNANGAGLSAGAPPPSSLAALQGGSVVLDLSLQEGSGTQLLAPNGEVAGHVEGAGWTTASRPGLGSLPILFRQEDLLEVRGGILQGVGATRAAQVLPGADGLVHLYYQRSDARLGGAALTTSVGRAQLVAYWGVGGAPPTVLDQALVLTTREVGEAPGEGASCAFGTLNPDTGRFDSLVLSVEVAGASGLARCEEHWPNVPANLADLVAVLNGQARPDGGPDSPTYDYGQVQVGLVDSRGVSRLQAVTLDVDRAYASALFVASGVDRRQDGLPAAVPAASAISTLLVGGEDACFARNPLPLTLLFQSGGGVANRSSALVAAQPGLLLPGDLTIESWVSDQHSGLSSCWLTGCQPGSGWQVGADGEGRLYAYRAGQEGGPSVLQRTSARLVPDWQHVAATWKSSFGLVLRDGLQLDCGRADDLRLRDALTVEGWFKVDSLPSNGDNVVLASCWDEGSGDTSWILEAGQAGLAWRVFDGASVRQVALDLPVQLGVWTQLAAVYQGSASRSALSCVPADQIFVELPAVDGPSFTSGTLELWVQPTSWATAGQVLVEGQRRRPGQAPDLGLKLQTHAPSQAGQLSLRLTVPQGSHDYASPLPTGPLTHLALTWQVVGQKVVYVLYIDGVAQPAVNSALPTEEATWGAWTLGATALGSSPSGFLAGLLSEFRLWSGYRSAGEVLDTLTRPVSSTTEGLAAAYRFEGRSGTAVVDQVSHHSVPIQRRKADDGQPPTPVTFVQQQVGQVMSLSWGDQVASATAGSNGPTSAGPLRLGGAATALGKRSFSGCCDDVRLWRCRRLPAQITYFGLHPLVEPTKDPTLAAAWSMDEGRGVTVRDVAGAHPGTVIGAHWPPGSPTDRLWVPTSFGGRWQIYLDGQPLVMGDPEQLDLDLLGGSVQLPTGLRMGAPSVDLGVVGLDGRTLNFWGSLAEVRLWSTCRTAAEVRRTFQQMVRGDEPDLVAAWGLRDGSGPRFFDRGPSAMDAVLQLPTDVQPQALWVGLYPPLTTEDPRVVDYGNQHVYPPGSSVVLQAAPSAADWYGQAASRRAFALVQVEQAQSVVELTGGEGLGDLERVYLGQVQLRPQVIGYLEGAPPVPVENLTVDSPVNPDRYVGTAQVSLAAVRAQAATTTQEGEWALGQGLSGSAEVKVRGSGDVIDLPFAAVAEGLVAMYLIEGDAIGGSGLAFNLEADLGVHGSLDGQRASGEEAERATGEQTVQEHTIVLAGGWEYNVYNLYMGSPSQAFLQAERFYRPNNMGAAVVRSATADLYAVCARGSGAVLGYDLRPVPGVPRQDNLLLFRLNPRYVKNGTLDGNVGFDRDVDWEPSTQEASYLRPRAVATARSAAARQRAEARDPSQRDFSNTYVWAADGGLRAEETEPSASRRDVLRLRGGLAGSLGVEGQFEGEIGLAVDVGVKLALDFTGDLSLNLASASEDQASLSLSLRSEVEGEGFLNRLADLGVITVDGTGPSLGYPNLYGQWVAALNSASLDPTFLAAAGLTATARAMVRVQTPGQSWTLLDVGWKFTVSADPTSSTLALTPPQSAPPGQYPVLYGSSALPGKVREYRFSTLYQHPTVNNFDRLFEAPEEGGEPVVDPAWLNSADPDAWAFRQARACRGPVWRVWHGVTYVSRVPRDPALGDPERDAAPAPALQVPSRSLRPDAASLVANVVLLEAAMDGVDRRAPDWTQVSLNVSTWLSDVLGGASPVVLREAHDRVMSWVGAVFAAGLAGV